MLNGAKNNLNLLKKRIMVKNLIITGLYYPEWIEISKELEVDNNCKFVYIAADVILHEKLKKIYQESVIHDGWNLVLGITPTFIEENIPPVPIDAQILEGLSHNESIFLRSMDRPYLPNLYTDRLLFYHKMLKYWYSVLCHFKPSGVIFADSPHLSSDYILLSLCIYLKIPTHYGRPSLFEEEAFLPADSLENLSDNVKILYEQTLEEFFLNNKKIDDYRLSEKTEALFLKISNKNIKIPIISEKIISDNTYKNKKQKLTNNTTINYILIPTALFFINTLNFFGINLSPIKFKKSFKSLLYDATIGNLTRLNEVIQLYNLKKDYNKRCIKPDLTSKYLVFFLHYQPEMTTSPLGGQYANQELAIDLLSKCIPDDWLIIVKEHFVTFLPTAFGLSSRNKIYYDRIEQIPKVRFVETDIASYELIDNAIAVATITGTPGYEAIMRGRPVITFGNAWYNYCEGVQNVKSFEDCQNAIDRIHSGVSVDIDKVKLYLHAIEKASIKRHFSSPYKSNDVILKENMKLNRDYVTFLKMWVEDLH